MATRSLNLNILDSAKQDKIHEATLKILSDIGVQVDCEKSRARYIDAGCDTLKNGRITIPEKVVDRAVFSAPDTLKLYTVAGEENMVIDKRNHVYFGTHMDQLEINDPISGQVRGFKRKDIALMGKIASALSNIDFGLTVGCCTDVASRHQSRISFLESLLHFDKTICISTNEIESFKEIFDMAALVAGGKKDLQKKPFIFFYCEPIPPLKHPHASTEKLHVCAENRIPVVYMPYCMMGGTAPMNFAAALAQCNAEVLSGLVLHQLVSEGAPFIYGAMPSIMDMQSTIGSYGAIEFHLLVAAASEMADRYNLPFFGTAGCTDAKAIDEQAAIEVTMEIYSTFFSKANLIHDVGIADHCVNISPELVVLCDEIISLAAAYSKGIEVNDDTLGLDSIGKYADSCNYLSDPYTMANFKSVCYPEFLQRLMENPSKSEIKAKIRAKTQKILKEHHVTPLDENIVAELRRWGKKVEEM
jgi:trimethylamine--corrinoid protein Co-methyltransferase